MYFKCKNGTTHTFYIIATPGSTTSSQNISDNEESAHSSALPSDDSEADKDYQQSTTDSTSDQSSDIDEQVGNSNMWLIPLFTKIMAIYLIIIVV